MPGKRIQFDEETWGAVDLLARDRSLDFQDLADEAFRDLLKKYNRPTGLLKALRRSAQETTVEAETDAAIGPKAAPAQPPKRGACGSRSRPRGKRRSAA